VESIDLEPARRRVAGVSLVAAADVRNPLLGTNGAVAVYAPQKGAAPDALVRLESGLARLAHLLEDAGEQAGDGAAGGVAFGLRAGLGAEVQPGARVFADAAGLDAACAQADGIVTGEGCYDEQTEHGKVAWEVANIAANAGIPCAIVAGRIERTPEELESDPFTWHLSLEEIARANPEYTTDADRLAAAGEHLARVAGA
jgi:glycerate kinase